MREEGDEKTNSKNVRWWYISKRKFEKGNI
jgi:hypothetical protein